MRELIRAYETLSDAAQRAEFDSMYVQFSKRREGTDHALAFDYRMWLMSRSDKESRAKLIFFDLLHNLEDEAVGEYLTRLSEPGGFVLSRYFDREDFMDCGFILAEELSFRNNQYEAFQLLAEVIVLEKKKPYFKHFFPEVGIFVRDIIRNKLALTVPDELALDCYETALELGLGKKEDAFILRQMAFCYDRAGDQATARICLEEALRFDPKLLGIADLKKRLNLYF
jgi:tetratricopeptide (TPR) repeat protein